eukprot:TRINITY_DN58877_c0_g1_i1.p1 TRINITY_DN58877_c0_g1~~TRINITY_DN58877_c0_g1_i1.p1  ORF type:complete len:327 (-),score=72.54 TRINITY_DN58877_c0_g1_i1:50-940(-)
MAKNASAVAIPAPQAIDLHKSTYEELRLCNVYTRQRQEICLAHGYNSEDDNSDGDEEEGYLHTARAYHDNGQLKYVKTYQNIPPKTDPEKGYLAAYERVVEEKHYSPEGVCMLDVHFGLGQPYLSRKHYHHNQRLKSEKLFFVEDERMMTCRKAGHWRTYYENGSIQSEVQYDGNGMRCSFCKRYTPDGSIEWCKDYTKDYIERVDNVNSGTGNVGHAQFGIAEASRTLGFPEGRLPKSAHEVNREYRRQCTLLHPDKSDAPDAAWRFEEATRARDLLLRMFESGGGSPKASDSKA